MKFSIYHYLQAFPSVPNSLDRKKNIKKTLINHAEAAFIMAAEYVMRLRACWLKRIVAVFADRY